MATLQKQLAANRENAKKSTGPRTSTGKNRAAQNARKHGLNSQKVGIDFMENKADLEAHRNSILSFYNPQNPMEMFWVDQIVVAQWRTWQLVRWESGIFNDAIRATWEENTDQDEEDSENLEQYVTNIEPGEKHSTQNWMLSNGMTKLMNKKDYLKTFLRYQAQAQRLIQRAEAAIVNLRNEAKISGQRIDAKPHSAIGNEPNSVHSPSPPAWQPVSMSQ